MCHISVVSPVYKAEDVLDQLVERLINTLSKITQDFEIILVDDYSLDGSWKRIKSNCENDHRIKGVKLSRNFGQHYAITAGLDHCSGEWVVVMDCDLQDQPEEIINLYEEAKKGYHIVLGKRHMRQDSYFKKLFSKIFYSCLTYLSGSPQDSQVANFGIYHRVVIEAISQMREKIRYFPSMINWVGFTRTKVNVAHAPRESGKSTYKLKKLFDLALDIVLAYSDKPLRLTVKVGLIIAMISFFFAIVIVVKALRGEIEVLGYASTIVSICFFSGLIIFILGIIGLYLGKTFEGVKNRPIYIVEKTIN